MILGLLQEVKRSLSVMVMSSLPFLFQISIGHLNFQRILGLQNKRKASRKGENGRTYTTDEFASNWIWKNQFEAIVLLPLTTGSSLGSQFWFCWDVTSTDMSTWTYWHTLSFMLSLSTSAILLSKMCHSSFYRWAVALNYLPLQDWLLWGIKETTIGMEQE